MCRSKHSYSPPTQTRVEEHQGVHSEIHETHWSSPQGTRRDWISSCFNNILSLLGPEGVKSGSSCKLKPNLTFPSRKSRSRGSSILYSLHFHFLGATRLDNFSSFFRNSPKKTTDARELHNLSCHSHIFPLPQKLMMITFLQSDQGVVSHG